MKNNSKLEDTQSNFISWTNGIDANLSSLKDKIDLSFNFDTLKRNKFIHKKESKNIYSINDQQIKTIEQDIDILSMKIDDNYF